MVEVVWSPQASEDLDSIVAFISKDSTEYARIFVVDVFHALDQISSFPKSGRIVPEFGDSNVREIILGNYRIIYRLKKDLAGLVTIHHGARDERPGR